MSDTLNGKPTTTFYVLGGFFLVWNLIGLYMYYGQSVADAIAVNAGVLAAIFLLLRKMWAVPFFVLSLVGALLQDLDAYVLRGALDYFDAVWLAIPITVLVICAIEIWYAMRAKAKGWLN